MDLNKEIQIVTDKVIAEKLPELVTEKVTKMLESIVGDIFSSYSTTAKMIKGKIEEKLDINLQNFDTIDYNALIAKTINDNLLTEINLQPILELTRNSIGFVKKKEIRLQEIADMFIEASQEENEQSGEGEITFIVEEKEDSSYISIYADIDPNVKKSECNIKFCFSTNGSNLGGIFHFKTQDRYIERGLKSISPAKLVSMDAIEAKIFRLYSAQVKITDFEHEPSSYWDRY